MVAASAAQSAATVVQAGTKEISSKVFCTSLISICPIFANSELSCGNCLLLLCSYC